jgi:hypothetical protein
VRLNSDTGLNTLGETDSDPAPDKPNHILAISIATTYPIYQSSSECDSDSSSEVHMVGQGDPPPDNTTEEIQREAEDEMA